MALRTCTVSFKSATGVTHSVDVQAETLYEAAATALAHLTKDEWIEGLGPATRLEIQVRASATTGHTVSVQQVHRWLDSVTTSPADVLRKTKLKSMLAR